MMDENNMHVNERRSASNVNGSARRGTAPSNLPIQNQGTPQRPSSLMDSPTQHSGSYTIVQVIVNRDEKGYGMKVSGDNPVYVQSVKAGGAAEKAGLYAGDKIIEVNGENVMSSTHTHVVGLIRSATQVILTVQQRIRTKRIDSPSLHTRSATSPSPHQITGPQPVDHEKLQQFKLQKTRQLQLMIEKEERYLEQLRSQYVLTPNEKTLEDLEKTERNLQKLKGTLLGHVGPIEQSPPSFSTSHNLSNEMRTHSNDSPPNILPSKSKTLPNSNKPPDVAPPLPKRNRPISDNASYRKSTQYANGLMINNPQNNNRNPSNAPNAGGDGNVRNYNHRRDRFLENRDTPPPLPPRNPRPQPISSENDLEAANSISKQMSYPLVATCATIINSYPLNHTHHRTKSSPESLLMMTPAEACRRLIASESMSDIRPPSYGQNATPPGTPPPPYPNASPEVTRRQSVNKDLDMDTTEDNVDLSFGSPSKDVSLNKVVGSADIHAASSQVAQQRIISMEDDEMSDQEVNQLDDHGPFKSLSRLWEHTPHLAVFMNYVLLNSDPNSLLFYLLTDLYKEGNAKDMRKWAYEIHSSFLVPGAPLRLANVDENIAHEIDDVLMREYDKEEILRKIFWKARNRAKEELTKQLNHFQQKRTAGLGTMYGPSDEKLFNMNHEKAREMKIYDTLLVDKLDPYVEEIDKENFDPKKYYTAAALATVIIRIFGVRVVAPLDRFPTFVNKEKSFRTKFMKYSRKLTIQGHQFNAQQYYTVIVCNHCHQIIYGIGPQGYQCSVCLINLHRTCVKLYDDSCPGPISKKDRSIQKVMEKIGHRGPKRKATPHSHSDRKQDEKDVDCLEVDQWKNLCMLHRDEVTKNRNKMPNKKRRGADSKQGKGSAKGGGTFSNNKSEKKPVKTDKNRPDLDDNKRTERRRTYSNNKKIANCDDVDSAITRVEIRHEVPINRAAIVADAKRYSDSFIQAGGYKIDSIDSNLSRSRSGFLIDDDKDSPKPDKADRKSRRFSDIFRYGTSRGDVELVKNQEEGKISPSDMKNKINAADKAKKGKINHAVKSADRNVAAGTPNKTEKTATTCSDNNSYLKRVKSKICRPKNDESTIYENDENVKERNSLRSSVSHFDFRLIRQTSNLEKVRPSALGHKKCASYVGVGDPLNDDKPILAKSKSSSAINLGLLRTRRNKILEQLKKNVKPAENEFDFITFARSQHNKTNFVEEPPEPVPETPTGDMKPNQSLSRTDSDRRPDAKTDNANQGSQEHIQDGEEAVTSMENTKSLPPFTDKKKNGSSINRSESVKESSEKQRKQRRNISDPLHNTSESGHIEATDLTWSGSTGSSSNTSINSNSRYSNESPTGGSAGCDSDGNIETDFLDWQSSLPEEELQRLSSHEKERQDIINELFHTERSHLRNLSILDRIFLKGIKEKSLLKEEEIQLVFPNLHEVLKIHSKFKCILKNKKIRDGKLWKNIGESLLTMFEGELGDTLQKVTATFCKNQQCALDLIKEKRRKDSKFNMGLNELEKNNDCRRLTLQGFIVSEMQRLAKYPLLIERLINIIEKAEISQDLEYSQMELNSLMRAHDRSKEILNHINDAAKRAWCKFRLEEIQNHLDTSLFLSNKDHAIVSEFKNIDLTNYNYVYDGPVHLKRQNKAHLQVHMVLLEEFVILLQRDSERYLLKFFQNGKPGQPPLAPIIKMSTLLVRTNAAFESSLFLVNTSAQSSMYELLTRDSAERKTWFTFLSNTVEAFKQPGGKTKSSEPLPDEEETVDELPNLQDAIERAETIGSSDTSGSEAEHGRNLESNPPNGEGSIEDKTDESSVEKEVSNDADSTGGGVSRKFTTEDWPLIQPSEVHADIPPVHSADIVLTPIEQIKRKGDEVSKAIDEKQNLCADVLNIDRKDFKIIADIASEANTRDPIDLVIASINQVDLIFKAVNESLTVTDVELIKGGMTPSCASQKNPNDLHRYPPEMSDIKEAATKLNRLLTELLEVVKDKDEDFLRLRKEQEKTREQLHARLSLECSAQNTDVIDNVPTEMTQTGDLESIEESLTENDMN